MLTYKECLGAFDDFVIFPTSWNNSSDIRGYRKTRTFGTIKVQHKVTSACQYPADDYKDQTW